MKDESRDLVSKIIYCYDTLSKRLDKKKFTFGTGRRKFEIAEVEQWNS